MIKVLMYVGIGTIAMLMPMIIIAASRKIKIWKSVPVALYATLTGTLSTYFWFFVENHWIGGISFFGAVFIVPLAFLLVRKPFRESYGNMMDMFAAGICMMLAVMKVQCLTAGCCGGRELFVNSAGVAVYFPSQIAELLNASLIMVILLALAFNRRLKGKLYPLFMIFYGITRFILNFFREEWVTHTGVLPPYGTIWSVLSVIIGTIWIMKLAKKDTALNASNNPCC